MGSLILISLRDLFLCDFLIFDLSRKEETDLESTGEPSSDSEVEDLTQSSLAKDPNAELPPEHWQIGKLVKYIKVSRIFILSFNFHP